MSSKCTREEIEEKKREAQLRFQQRREESLKQKENRLKFPEQAEVIQAKASPGKASAPSKSKITQNRHSPYSHSPPKPVQNVDIRNSAVMIDKSQVSLLGKAIAPSKALVPSTRPSPYQKPLTKQVLCTLEIISNDRFAAKISDHSETIINVFRNQPTKSYNQQNRTWSWNLSEYESLLQKIKHLVNVVQIPDFVMDQIKKPEPTMDESCLEAIEPVLVNSLFKFQRESVCYGIARNGKFLLADDMGLGKTRQALAIADFYKEDWPLLIITTASARDVWQNEIIMLLPKANVLDICIMHSSKDHIMSAKILICTYSSLENNLHRLEGMNFGMVILDESHSIKNRKSKQSINATRLCKNAKHVIMISGTPALSRPVELFPQLQILDPTFATFYNFTKRYCDGRNGNFGWEANGSTHLSELNIILRKKFMIRRTKEEVYSELGAKNREIVILDNMHLKATELVDMEELCAEYYSAEGKKKDQKDILLKWYTETAKLKTDATCRFVIDFLHKTNEKCLIFAHHISLIDSLIKCLSENKIRYMTITGSTNAIDRATNVEKFQSDPLIRCAVLSLKACSAGITLTAATTVIFSELDWSPSNMIQAEARAHRIGQERNVKCIYLIAPDTSDEIMLKMLEEKQRNLTKVGLVTVSEHLSQNMAKSKFDGTPAHLSSKPAAAAPSLITDYFEKSPNSTTSSDIFFTCESVLTESDDILNSIDLQAIEAEEKLKKTLADEMEFLKYVNFDEEDDVII